MKKIIQLWCPPQGLVLDPYAGSGTTGHAVLELNQEVGAERRFILIEQGSPATGDKYARSLTWQRLHNVIAGQRPGPDGKLTNGAEPVPGGFEFRMLTPHEKLVKGRPSYRFRGDADGKIVLPPWIGMLPRWTGVGRGSAAANDAVGLGA